MKLRNILAPVAALFIASTTSACDDEPKASPLPVEVMEYISNTQGDLRDVASYCLRTPEGVLREFLDADYCYRENARNLLANRRVEFEETFSSYTLRVVQDGNGYEVTAIPRAVSPE